MSTLLSDIVEFCTAHDLSESQFGELVMKDRKFVSQVRAGRDLRMSTVAKARSFMLTYKPEAEAA